MVQQYLRVFTDLTASLTSRKQPWLPERKRQQLSAWQISSTLVSLSQFTALNHCTSQPLPTTDRERKKNEALAAKVFGKGRRNSAPGAAASGNKKAGPGPSLASRVGVQKVCYITLQDKKFKILIDSTAAFNIHGYLQTTDAKSHWQCRCRMDPRSSFPQQSICFSCLSATSP